MREPLDRHETEGDLKYYRVLLRGHLAPAPAGSEVEPRGFYVSRIVAAANSNEAGAAAIQLFQREHKYRRLVVSYGGQAPDLNVEEVAAAPDSDRDVVNKSGYVFFEDE